MSTKDKAQKPEKPPKEKDTIDAATYQLAVAERDAALVLAGVYRDVLRQVAEHAPLDPGASPTLLGSLCLLAQKALEKEP